MTLVPTIETPRLALTGRTPEDFEDYAVMWRDPDVVRFTSGEPLAREDAWRAFGRLAGVWMLFGYGPWIVREKTTGAFVGDLGPCEYGRDSEPRLEPAIEFGWALAPSMHGKGYATEALQATIDWMAAHGPKRRYCAMINPENGASHRVAAKLGFARTGTVVHKGKTLDLLHRDH
jgi:RimJ/RimL family protein N-acetyltransferase